MKYLIYRKQRGTAKKLENWRNHHRITLNNKLSWTIKSYKTIFFITIITYNRSRTENEAYIRREP